MQCADGRRKVGPQPSSVARTRARPQTAKPKLTAASPPPETCVCVIAGLWLSLDGDGKTLVLDVEGTDGRERGEDQVRRHASPPPHLGCLALL